MSSSLISNAVSILDKLQPTESSSVYISMQSKCKFCSSWSIFVFSIYSSIYSQIRQVHIRYIRSI
jgi:hypothetical protein